MILAAKIKIEADILCPPPTFPKTNMIKLRI